MGGRTVGSRCLDWYEPVARKFPNCGGPRPSHHRIGFKLRVFSRTFCSLAADGKQRHRPVEPPRVTREIAVTDTYLHDPLSVPEAASCTMPCRKNMNDQLSVRTYRCTHGRCRS